MFVTALRYLKAIASLVGVTATALVAAAELPLWVTLVAVGATAVATAAIPNIELGEVE
ncbi:hypothetical protein [Jiangella anatolica]|uniref:hypothetical protein n=1 Tax=Jiangella anatolica TaxID=2670374 RepID=UPI001314451D|nr:hypothetical protein [Jiangella anatolica]